MMEQRSDWGWVCVTQGGDCGKRPPTLSVKGEERGSSPHNFLGPKRSTMCSGGFPWPRKPSNPVYKSLSFRFLQKSTHTPQGFTNIVVEEYEEPADLIHPAVPPAYNAPYYYSDTLRIEPAYSSPAQSMARKKYETAFLPPPPSPPISPDLGYILRPPPPFSLQIPQPLSEPLPQKRLGRPSGLLTKESSLSSLDSLGSTKSEEGLRARNKKKLLSPISDKSPIEETIPPPIPLQLHHTLVDVPWEMPKLRRKLALMADSGKTLGDSGISLDFPHPDSPKRTLGLRPSLDLRIRRDRAKFDVELPLEAQEWFHGSIERRDAEEALRPTAEGTFLLRHASASSAYSLSIKSPRGFIHIRIERNSDGCYCLGELSFVTVPALVAHFMKHRLPIRGAEQLILSQPLPNLLL